MDIRINSYIPVTEVEGVGKRFAIWVQGCSLHCKGCANVHMWDKNIGTLYKTEEINDIILSYKDKIEGITFLGGEPLEQIEAVTEIAKTSQKIGLSVIVFTGYKYDEVKNDINFIELCKYTDILIDGRYEEDKRDFSRPWIGSSNQHYYFLSDKYNENVIKTHTNKIEIRINKDNKIFMNGMGDFKQIIEMVG